VSYAGICAVIYSALLLTSSATAWQPPWGRGPTFLDISGATAFCPSKNQQIENKHS
jgi:hypothetical protein